MHICTWCGTKLSVNKPREKEEEEEEEERQLGHEKP
jgi:hypothetical protein